MPGSSIGRYWGANQFKNTANPTSHYETTGPELWSQTGGKIDYLIHGVGTGGTLAGAGKYLKEKKPSVKTIAIEPSNARVHIGAPPAPHTILGIGAGIVTNFIDMPKDGSGGACVRHRIQQPKYASCMSCRHKLCSTFPASSPVRVPSHLRLCDSTQHFPTACLSYLSCHPILMPACRRVASAHRGQGYRGH